MRGHHVAELDPLGILDADLQDVHPPELELSHYGFNERDLDKQITLGPGILPHFATEDRKTMSLGEIIKTLKRIYCELTFSSSVCLYKPHIRWCRRNPVCTYPGQGSVRLDS